jgi:sigma-B regulation protein RsbU (phosphoserine phosphatase)
MAKANRCVILVDDEQNILNALRRELHDWAIERELEVLTAASGQKGLDILSERGGDTVLVVSDLKMPEMKGSDFLMAVRDKYPDIVTILLTGYSETEEVIKAVRAGIFSYMLKPWDSDYLVAELQKAFEYGELKRQNARYLKTMEEELKWAGEMQKAILKPSLPRTDGVEFRASYRPVPNLYCGGDYYDVIFLSADRYLLLIGDVAGHGVRAALVTGILKAVIYSEYLRAQVGKEFSPGAFLSWLNERMNFELRSASGLIVTFFAGLLDMKAETFRYANAGQTHPVIMRQGKAMELPVSGSGLGFANSITYIEQVVDIQTRDVITLYTDGLTEPGGADGCEPVKPAQLFEGVAYSQDYHRRLMEAALAESERTDFDDDVTIVTARIL